MSDPSRTPRPRMVTFRVPTDRTLPLTHAPGAIYSVSLSLSSIRPGSWIPGPKKRTLGVPGAGTSFSGA